MLNRILSLICIALGLTCPPVWAVPITSFPATISGDVSPYDLISSVRLGSSGYYYYADHYEVNVVPGQQLTINMSTTDFDGYLYVLDSAGQVLASNDDYLDTRHSQVIHTAVNSGTLTIETTTYSSNVYSGNGSLSYAGYTLSVGSVGGGAVTTPTLSLPASSMAGDLVVTDAPAWSIIGAYADRYLINLAASQTIAIDHQSANFDAYLSVYDPYGTWQVSNDDFGGTLNSHISFTAPFAGTYTIEATSLSAGRTGAYTISVAESTSASTLYPSFYVYPSSGAAPLYVSFSNSSYSSNYNDLLSYYWDFGNGTTSTASSPTAAYLQAGTYNVVLTVRNQLGQAATYSGVVTATAAASAVTAYFQPSSTTAQANLPITFYNGSYSSYGIISSYTWEFGDGQFSTLANPTHTYATSGTYTVRLTVMDSNGQVGTSSQSLTVQASTASFSVGFRPSSTSARTGEAVTFVNQTYSPTGGLFYYLWSFGDGTGGSADASPTHPFSQAGVYVVTLTATNQLGQSASSSQTVTVTAGATLTSNFSFSVNSTTTTQIAFTNSSTSSNSADVLAYSWAFGDGQTSTDRNPTHTYSQAGSYTVTLAVSNTSGQTATSTPQSLTVTSSTSGSINVTGVVRLKPQALMGGFDPMLIDVADTSFKLLAIVRPGATPIQSVQFGSGSGGFAQSMTYAGTYASGDQRYEATLTFPRGSFPQSAVLGDLLGGDASQFRMSVVDSAQQQHFFPQVAFGNTPALTMPITSPNGQVSSTPGTVRLSPQVLAAGFDPMLIDIQDSSFDFAAIVRTGVVPIQSVSLTTNQSTFAQAMNFVETLPNGDKKYKATFTFTRGAFAGLGGQNLAGLFGTQAGQFNATVTDQAQQTHSFPEIRFGNYPAL
ncbi:MAG: PKD domain-containing protein [Sulfurisoma sp.]|nr:PKD domain-containing protein [Sulfurisoma sp.]